MPRPLAQFLLGLAFVSLSWATFGQETKTAAKTFPLDSLAGLETVNIQAEVADYRGQRAVRLLPPKDQGAVTDPTKYSLAILDGTDFKDGTIEVKLAGTPRTGAPAEARGFIGIAFRVAPHGTRFECFYLRPTNGRTEDQLRRNHSVQYISAPDFPWNRLRAENPGVYESYVDIEPGVWTSIRIVVAGTKARLYVNGAEQPCLIVNDLKPGDSRGQIALWTTVETDGYFSNLTVK
jgi:hypothetical protein